MNEKTFKRKLALFERLQDELNDIVYEVVPKYYALTGRWFARWVVKGFQRRSDSLEIDLEDIYDGDTDSIFIPLEWFYDFPGAKSKLEEQIKRKKEEDKTREEAARIAQAKSLEETERLLYEKLKSKYEANKAATSAESGLPDS